MVDVIQSWLGSRQYAVLDKIVLMPRRVDVLSALSMVSRGEQGSSYYLVDDDDNGWVLKKFFRETEPDNAYVEAIQAMIPEKTGFESGFGRRVLRTSSVSSLGYAHPDFQDWIDGTILMPQVTSPTWAELSVSIREGSAVLSRVERLLLCQKLSEMVGWLESAGLAHRDLSSTNVLMDTLNIEIHLIDWDSLFHATLEMPANTNCGTDGYIAPFVKADGTECARATWQEDSDRFGLAILNSELLIMKAGPSLSGGVISQADLQNLSGKGSKAFRDDLRHAFPAAVEFLDAALAARSFAACPSPSDWINLTERELASSDQTTWEQESSPVAEVESLYAADYEPHFVDINKSAFVRIDQTAFVKAPAAR